MEPPAKPLGGFRHFWADFRAFQAPAHIPFDSPAAFHRRCRGHSSVPFWFRGWCDWTRPRFAFACFRVVFHRCSGRLTNVPELGGSFGPRERQGFALAHFTRFRVPPHAPKPCMSGGMVDATDFQSASKTRTVNPNPKQKRRGRFVWSCTWCMTSRKRCAPRARAVLDDA